MSLSWKGSLNEYTPKHLASFFFRLTKNCIFFQKRYHFDPMHSFVKFFLGGIFVDFMSIIPFALALHIQFLHFFQVQGNMISKDYRRRVFFVVCLFCFWFCFDFGLSHEYQSHFSFHQVPKKTVKND